jgi:hypothetical protein
MRIPIAFLTLVSASSLSALTATEWQFRQTIEVPTAGLTRINLPAETLGIARPDLSDLRIVSSSGAEIPYLIEQPKPKGETNARPKDFRAQLGFHQTELNIVTGTEAPLTGVLLDIPAGPRFTKAVRVEGSRDQISWQTLTTGAPIFRTQTAGIKSRVPFPEGAWPFLRVILDDSRSEPVPVTGAELILSGANAPAEKVATRIASRHENDNVTRIALDLGAANLLIASLLIETPEPLFTRHVTVAASALAGDRLYEQTMTTGVVYRVETNGATDERLEVPVEKENHGRELIVFIENGDDASLAVSSISVTRRIVRLLFSAPAAGTYALLSGNAQCAAPRYNFTPPRANVFEATISPLASNPGYVAQVEERKGALIDLASWKFRKPIRISKPGAQQIELDSDVLSHSASDLRDVRVISENRQLPYLIDATSILSDLPLRAIAANDPQRPTLSRWSLKLPQSRLPITSLTGASSSLAFERNMRSWEEITDERGEKYARDLGRTIWRHPAANPDRDLVLKLDASPLSDTLLLETDNHDNPAMDLKDVRGHYPITRILFSAPSDSSIWLYYGNNDASVPQYDTSVMADELLRAGRSQVAPGTEEKLKTNRVTETLSGAARYIFWGALGLVVIILLVLISRLLPKTES